MAPTAESGSTGFSTVAQKYIDIIQSNGITDPVADVIVKDANLKGEGMASQAYYVTIKFVNESKSPLNLFVKSVSASPVHTGMLNDSKLFEKEGRFFTKYVPAAKEFCKSKGYTDMVNFYPKCYYGDNNLIVCENLVVDKGYTLLNKEEQQDMESVRFGITSLAKHHAISYAMIQDAGGPEKFFERFPNLDFEGWVGESATTLMSPMMENMNKLNIKLLEDNNLEGKDHAINSFAKAIGKIHQTVTGCLTHEPNEFLTLGHGDYWNNNMMFLKDRETNKIMEHMMVDLQVTRYNSPALDVSYYLYTSVKPEVRRANLQEILELYLDVLKSTADKLGYPINMSYSEFFEVYRRKLKYGYWLACTLLNVAGFAAFKDLEVGGMEDLIDWSVQYDASVKKWIVQNPEKSENFAKNCILLVKEYDELVIE